MSRECNKINNNNNDNNDNRERKIKSGSRRRVCEVRELLLSLSYSLVAFPPAKIVITFCLTEALLWEGDTCKADYWLKGSMGNEVNK